MLSTLGMLEISSIARGIEIGDIMLKAADVSILFAKHVCIGKYLILISGDVGDVEESIQVGINKGGKAIIDSFILPAVHEQVINGIRKKYNYDSINAIGIVEAKTISSGILMLDKVLKSGQANLIKLIIGNTIGGKCYFIVTGDVSSIDEALSRGEKSIECDKLLYKTTIPSPEKELLEEIL